MNKDFRDFQTLFKKYQDKFGLIGYKVYFSSSLLTDGFADLTVTQASMVATARLSSTPGGNHPTQSAKHEAIHLLLSKLEDRACDRCVSLPEIYEVVEELVFKLEKLIPDIKD